MKQKRTRLVLITSALLSAVLLTSCSSQTPEVSPTSADSCERAVTAGLSAYELWITQGNTGSLQDFFDSLVGEKGENGYVGADGVNGEPGAPGKPGASAYQLWLDAGNSGTPEDFLNSIAGADGLDGLNGLSAYQLWLSLGNTGTTQDFLDSLVGATGQQGIPGVCTSGDVGPQGPAGPVGPSGSPGPTGATGPQGIQGIQGIQGPIGVSPVLYYGSFYDTTDQANNPVNTVRAMRLNNVTPGVDGVIGDGVSVVNGSRITIAHTGVYNLQFSAQLYNGSGAATVDIWLAKNGQPVAQTNTQEYIPANNRVVAAWNFVVDATAGDYYEFMWYAGSDVNTVINSVGPRTVGSYTIPAIPGLIVTVTQAR